MYDTAVVIPVYKNDDLEIFKKSVESILKQTYQGYKLFIAVDGPLKRTLDNYLEVLERQDVTILKYSENRGLAAVLNSSFRYCKNKNFKYLVRMDADDIALPQRLQKQIDYLENHPEIDVLGTQAYVIDADDNIYGKKDASPYIDYSILKKKCDIIHPSVIFRASFFDIVGFYNEEAILAEDYDLWFRAIRKNIKILSIKDRLFLYRFDKNNIKRRKKAQKEIIKVKLKYLRFFDYIYLIPHMLVRILPSFILKIFIDRSIKIKEK
jgi:glycosyltransferase involved in cell wall biosynthesis